MDDLTKDKLADIKDVERDIEQDIGEIGMALKNLVDDWQRLQAMKDDLWPQPKHKQESR